MSRWKYRVVYRQGTKLKDRLFDDEHEAQDFAQKQRNYNNDYVFERVRYVPYLENLCKAELRWRQIQLPIWELFALCFVIFIVWECFQ